MTFKKKKSGCESCQVMGNISLPLAPGFPEDVQLVVMVVVEEAPSVLVNG